MQFLRHILRALALMSSLTLAGAAFAQQEAPAVEIEKPAAQAPATTDRPASDAEAEADDDSSWQTSFGRLRMRTQIDREAIVHFFSDSTLAEDERADAVIAIGGSATSAGEVADAVVSVLGNTRVTGPVGNGAGAVFGDTYIDSEVGGDVFAVFGNLELGPNAIVGGEVVTVGGTLKRDPGAIVSGGVQEVSFGGEFGRLEWLRPWLKHCLFLGRPLAVEPGLGWAWSLALGFLALYVLIALLFGSSVEKCVATLEQQPGQSVLAALLTMLLTPVVLVLLAITVIGIALVPFVGLAIFFAGFFGKAVVLAALGRRITRFVGGGPLAHVSFAVLIGGAIVLGLYLIPFVGFIVYKLLGILGLGVVAYTLLLAVKAKRDRRMPPSGTASAAVGAAPPSQPQTSASFEGAGMAASGPAEPTAATPPAQGAAAASAALPRADFWIRMAALFVDLVLIGVAVSALDDNGDLMLLALAAYGAVMWKLKGTTVGGILCHLQVVRFDGREMDWGTSIVRALSCFLSLAVAGLGFFWILFDKERQAWHDKIAGTVVVRVTRSVSLV